MATAMLNNKNLAQNLWAETLNTSWYIINRVYLRESLNKTAYELWCGKTPNVKYFKVFDSTCYILRDRENLEKFDSKSDEGIFLGYSLNSRAFRVYNLRTSSVQ